MTDRELLELAAKAAGTDKIDTSALRKLAEAASGGGHHVYTFPRDSNNWQANEDFIAACTRETILSLLDELDALRSRPDDGMRAAMVKLSRALGHPTTVDAAEGQCVEAALIEMAADALRSRANAGSGWQPIETAPRDKEAWFWIRPKTDDETYHDTSDRPIRANGEPHAVYTKHGRWGSLWKATHWMPNEVPAAPAALHQPVSEDAAISRATGKDGS